MSVPATVDLQLTSVFTVVDVDRERGQWPRRPDSNMYLWCKALAKQMRGAVSLVLKNVTGHTFEYSCVLLMCNDEGGDAGVLLPSVSPTGLHEEFASRCMDVGKR